MATLAAQTPTSSTSKPTPQTFSFSGITFDAVQFEVPEGLELAWRTLGGVEDIPTSNGVPAQRVAQCLGVVMETIKFSASFIGPNALTKALALEALQKAQNSGPFQFGARTITCTIFALTEKYRSINDITYSVELEPLVETTTTSQIASLSATSALSSNVSDIGSYSLANIPAADITSNVSSAIAISQNTSVAGASLSTLNSLLKTYTAAQADLQTLMAAKEGSTAAADTQTYLAAAGLAGLLANATSTLSSFTGANGTSVNTGGANAYTLAVRYTGSIDNADAIIAANAITDPFNLGTAQIVIPAALKALQ